MSPTVAQSVTERPGGTWPAWGPVDHGLALSGVAPPAGHVQGVYDQFGAQVIGDGPADREAGEHVDHDRAVDPALAGAVLGDVGDPQLVRGVGDRAGAGRAVAPRVEPRRGHAQDPAGHRDENPVSGQFMDQPEHPFLGARSPGRSTGGAFQDLDLHLQRALVTAQPHQLRAFVAGQPGLEPSSTSANHTQRRRQGTLTQITSDVRDRLHFQPDRFNSTPAELRGFGGGHSMTLLRHAQRARDRVRETGDRSKSEVRPRRGVVNRLWFLISADTLSAGIVINAVAVNRQ